jgi:pyrimidine-nucleoside phosphorylase
MPFLPLLERKRDGGPLTAEEIAGVVAAFTAGRIPDSQMAAFLMAVLFRGLSTAETRALTLAMRDSGDVLRWPDDGRPVVDKHSTGGVGDKISLPLVPLLARLGFRVPMISGRGLGITGGTLDKLEAIPGFTTRLPADRLQRQVADLGAAMAGQTDRLVPADRRLYALRDATGTVPSIPLITASILSKKLAEGLDALVLDVKHGRAAFMPHAARAAELARGMVALGNACGVRTVAFLSAMDAPLGRAAGNWLEVVEAEEILAGRGPADVRALVLEGAARLLSAAGRAADLAAGRAAAAAELDSGRPREHWRRLIAAQDGDVAAYERRLAAPPAAPCVHELPATEDGVVQDVDARLVGEVVRDLGAGRFRQEDAVHPFVGVDALRAPGESVRRGEALVRIHAADEAAAQRAADRLRAAFPLAAAAPPRPPLVTEVPADAGPL